MRAIRFTILSLALWALTASAATDLADDFRRPPPAAKPWVYWFFMDGNLSRAGITADLEAMQKAGIGGLILMEVDVGVPKGPVKFMGPEWRALFKHAVQEAERLGLEMTLNAGPGWTGSGGPWVKPEQSMQHLVASETNIVGGQRFEGLLPVPPPRRPFFGAVPAEMEPARQAFYRDVAVLAVPAAAAAGQIADLDEQALYVRAPYSSQPGVKPYLWPASAAGSPAGLPAKQVVDLTSRLAADGRLVWEAPEGNWTILRFGRRTTGANTRPAPQPGLGFESDKFDRAALDAHFDAFVGALLREIGPRPANRTAGWTALHIDSWEMGAQNWTENFRAEFRRRRGYDPLPYLPVMTGRLVDDRSKSERFLWDLRQTSQELVIENHAQHLKELGRRHGFKLSIEPYDMNPCSDLSLGGVADIPMCEFWSQGHGFDSSFSCLESVSIAHTLGRPLVAAEAFTAASSEAWRLHPGAMKPQADWALCMGINRLVFHRYAHQPWLDRAPGMTMGPYGVHYERTQTWWGMIGGWHDYLARCQAMLRRGQPVADICYLAPEGAPMVWRPPASALRGQRPVPDRPGYNFDGCAPETLQGATVKNGQVVLPGGASYRVLVLPGTGAMTPALLRKVRDLAKAGATVIGNPPNRSPSLTDYPQCDVEIQRLAAELWGGKTTENKLGKGRVVWSASTIIAPGKTDPALSEFPASTRWIWHAEGRPAASAPVSKRRFQRTFEIPAGAAVKSAHLLMTADNTFAAQLNGKAVGEGDSFHFIYSFEVKSLLKPGSNQLSVLAENGGDAPNPAGLIGALVIKFNDGRELCVATDRQWQSAELEKENWQAALELGSSGMAPWGKPSTSGGSKSFPDYYGDYREVATLLNQMGVPPDFEADAYLRYTHRTEGNTDIYFVANPSAQPVTARCEFRVTGKKPELWDPLTGALRRAEKFSEQNGRTVVTLELEQAGSVFVVFNRNWGAGTPASPAARTSSNPATEVRGPWEVSFPPGRGAPEKITLAELVDLAKHPEPGVKYFSGEATYRTSVAINPQTAIRNPQCFLDLGNVAVMARVKVNGQDLGVLWKAPYRVDISAAVKPGNNTLEITVANLWPNRLIGDQSLAPEQRITKTTWNPYKKDSQLPASGLLGPVRVETAR